MWVSGRTIAPYMEATVLAAAALGLIAGLGHLMHV